MKLWQKNILSAAVVVIVGLVLFMLAFILLALLTNVAESLFSRSDGVDVYHWSRIGLLILTVLLLPLVLRTRLPISLKAAYLTLPLMTTLILIGIALHARPPWMAYVSGATVVVAVLIYVLVRRKPWQYAFTALYVAAIALYAQWSGMQI
ncbi:MAG: hypothetical protein PHP02_05425 [Eubacteriales bacterium]|nr:hypothetical protein [Eubacteriales bacterium]